MMCTSENYDERSGRAAFVLVVMPRTTTTFGEMAIEKGDQCSLLRRMSLPAVGCGAAGRRKRDRVALVDVARNDNRMDVRFSTDRRRVAELRGNEPHRQRHVSLGFALVAWRAQFGENR